MKKRPIADRIAFGTDLPDVTLPGQPLIEIAGESRVLIENPLGVTQYGCDCIRVKVKYGQVCVSGSCLALARMIKGQLVISGQIDAVSLCRG